MGDGRWSQWLMLRERFAARQQGVEVREVLAGERLRRGSLPCGAE